MMKQGFVIIHLALITAAAYLCVSLLYSSLMDLENTATVPWQKQVQLVSGAKKDENRSVTDTGFDRKYQAIASRNLFNIREKSLAPPGKKKTPHDSTAKEKTDKAQEETQPLDLKLWGTVTGEDGLYAVIEDTRTKEQVLYQTDDLIRQARVTAITTHRVVLDIDGGTHVLEMETLPAGEREAHQPVAALVGTENIEIKEALLNRALEDLPKQMRKVRIKPHITDGMADGLLIYGIRPGSVFKTMGFKNGDIIREINGMPATVEEDAARIYKDLEDAETTTVLISRKGADTELIYHVSRPLDNMNTYSE